MPAPVEQASQTVVSMPSNRRVSSIGGQDRDTAARDRPLHRGEQGHLAAAIERSRLPCKCVCELDRAYTLAGTNDQQAAECKN